MRQHKKKRGASSKPLPKYVVVNGRAVMVDESTGSPLDFAIEEPATQDNSNNGGYTPYQKKVSQRVLHAIDYAISKSQRRANQNNGEDRIYNHVTGNYDNICNGINGSIILKVRKGKHIFQYHYCADCKKANNPIWRYRESNYGMIHLCNICKILAFERSFGHADAMPLKINHAHAHKGGW